MAETNLNVFANGVASYLSSCIFPAIVQGFSVKGVATSVEELMAMTNTPAPRTPATPVVSTQTVPTIPAVPAVPAMAFGGAVPTMAQAVAPTASRKTSATSVPVAGRTCMYQFKRGENKGKYCGKATAPGTDYCNACLKTRKNITKEMAAGTVPGAAPGMGGFPGMGGVPPGYTAPGSATGATPSASAQGGQLSVVLYDEERGLFREPNHNFIVYQASPGVIAVIGRINEADNKIVALTPQEQATAQAIGLVLGEGAPNGAPLVASQDVPVAPVPASQTPSVPAIPAIPSVPAIPSAVPTGVSAVPAIPNAQIQSSNLSRTGQPLLPVITPLAAPNGAGVPQIPSIPQLGSGDDE